MIPQTSLAGLLPRGVSVAETRSRTAVQATFPEEARQVRDAVETRRAEYLRVRECARACLDELGVERTAILDGADRAPRWPTGLVGSMTHCDGYAAAAVARDTDVRALGIDAEPNLPLPPEVFDVVVTAEDALVRLPEVAADRLLFSAKESVFKAWYPLTRKWLDFVDVAVELAPPGGRLPRTGAFRVKPLAAVGAAGEAVLRGCRGTWTADRTHVLTAVVVS